MKSYKNHLKDTKSFGEEKNLDYKPTMRSSAVFPLIIRSKKIDTIYTFMGYWLRKRNISLVTAVLTARDLNGEKVNVKTYEINSTKSYVFKGSELINKTNKVKNFTGSVEIEIFSALIYLRDKLIKKSDVANSLIYRVSDKFISKAT